MKLPISPVESHPTPSPSAPQAPKLLERLRMALTSRRYRPDTVGRFVEWNRQFILFHGKRHPESMGRRVPCFRGCLAG